MQPVARSSEAARAGGLLIPATLGVRHHSPAGALAVLRALETQRPDCILLEAPADAIEALLALADPRTEPPVALLAFSAVSPVHRFSYPLSTTSPEWIALCWAREHGVPIHGIDLPVGLLLGLDATAAESAPSEEATSAEMDPHERFARAAGATDFSTWWERYLEHRVDVSTLPQLVETYAKGLRALLDPSVLASLELREAIMRRRIREVLASGLAPERCLLVCGALHAHALVHALPSMTDAEFASLRHLDAFTSAIPYSQSRLASASGYGAGLEAPAYSEALGESLARGAPEMLASRFLSELAGDLRDAGHAVSPAEVIDALVLARTLASMADSAIVTLRDLHDAARTCFSRVGEEALEEAFSRRAVGTRVGKPGGDQRRSPLEWQVRDALQRLGLARFLEDRPQELRLDLRGAETGAHWFHSQPHLQSRLLHRLHAAGLHFAEPTQHAQSPWEERWRLQWTPALEAELAKQAQIADSLEDAARGRLEETLSRARSVEELSLLVVQATCCEFPELVQRAELRLAPLAHAERRLAPLTGAASRFSELMRRRPDHRKLIAPMRDALLRGAISRVSGLAQPGAADPEAFETVAAGLVGLLRLAAGECVEALSAKLEPELVWLASGTGGCPRTRGLAFNLAMRRGLLADAAVTSLLSRWLSRGEDPRRAAEFFEGLLHHQRLEVLENEALWRHVDAWVAQASPNELLHALVPFRRLNAALTPAERRRLHARLDRLRSNAGEDVREDEPATHSGDALARALEPLDALDLDP